MVVLQFVRRTIAIIVALGALALVVGLRVVPRCGGGEDASDGGANARARGPTDASPNAANSVIDAGLGDAGDAAQIPAADALVHVMYPGGIVCTVRELLGSEGPAFVDRRIERVADKLTRAFTGLTNWQYREVTRFEGSADRAVVMGGGTVAIYVERLEQDRVKARLVVTSPGGEVRTDTRVDMVLGEPFFVGWNDDSRVTVVLWIDCAIR